MGYDLGAAGSTRIVYQQERNLGRNLPTSAWPPCDAHLLQEIAAAFLKRRKAIVHKAKLSCDREFSESAAAILEKLHLDVRVAHARLSLGLSFWADGVMWLGLCVSQPGRNAGWAFKDNFNGNVLDVSAAALVEMAEMTLALRCDSDSIAESRKLREIWARVGPWK